QAVGAVLPSRIEVAIVPILAAGGGEPGDPRSDHAGRQRIVPDRFPDSPPRVAYPMLDIPHGCPRLSLYIVLDFVHFLARPRLELRPYAVRIDLVADLFDRVPEMSASVIDAVTQFVFGLVIHTHLPACRRRR